MIVVICGSRSVKQLSLIRAAMRLSKMHDKATEIISGGSKIRYYTRRHGWRFGSADYLGELWAAENGLPVLVIPAQWDRYGKNAGMIRNVEMLRRAHAVVAVWDGASRGTAHTLGLARKAGKPWYCLNVSTGEFSSG